MRLTLRTPPRRRAKALGALGTAIGALPIGVKPTVPSRPSALRLGVPAAVLAVLAVTVVARRRRREDPAPDSWAASAPSTASTATASPTPAPEAPATETAREKAEATGEVESVQETPLAGGGETTASAEAGAVRKDDEA